AGEGQGAAAVLAGLGGEADDHGSRGPVSLDHAVTEDVAGAAQRQCGHGVVPAVVLPLLDLRTGALGGGEVGDGGGHDQRVHLRETLGDGLGELGGVTHVEALGSRRCLQVDVGGGQGDPSPAGQGRV